MSANEAEKKRNRDRKRPVRGAYYLSDRPTIINVTVCTKHRKRWLASEEVHMLLRQVWQEASAWLVGRYVIMPDHIHFFVGFSGSSIPFDDWMTFWKSMFTKKHKVADHEWLARQWDRKLRNQESYDEKWEYIKNNPVRHRLVEKPEDWPHQGELNVLPW